MPKHGGRGHDPGLPLTLTRRALRVGLADAGGGEKWPSRRPESSHLRRAPRSVDRRAGRAAPRSSRRSSGASSKSCAFRSAISTACCAARRWWRRRRPAMRGGVTMTTTLLAKDTSHRTVFRCSPPAAASASTRWRAPATSSWWPTRTTFRVLPWAPNTGWVLCDIYFPNGKPVPFSTRALFRDALARLAAGLRLFRRARGRVPSVQARRSAACARTMPPGRPRRRP